MNFNDDEIDHWKEVLPDAEHIVLHLNHVSNNMTWESLYPEWIDEEEEFEVPTCPSLPKLKIPGKPRLDLVAVKLPCNRSGSWSRDVARLHLQLEAARLAASSKGYHPVHVLLVTDCFPIPNLFTGKELVLRKGNAWLFDPNLNTLRDKLQLPVGSCELAVPLQAKGQTYSSILCCCCFFVSFIILYKSCVFFFNNESCWFTSLPFWRLHFLTWCISNPLNCGIEFSCK